MNYVPSVWFCVTVTNCWSCEPNNESSGFKKQCRNYLRVCYVLRKDNVPWSWSFLKLHIATF
jgi:hypothetical protein